MSEPGEQPTPELAVQFKNISFRFSENSRELFSHLSFDLPKGILSLTGPNGIGKSTFLLLAGARLLPTQGRVLILDQDSRKLTDEQLRSRYVSFIYQNMEFETEEPIGTLLEYVYDNSFYIKKDSQLVQEVIRQFELQPILHRKTQEVSKGELQRTIMAFSLLYGSKIIIMDEPIFAMEEHQKEQALDYVGFFAKEQEISVFYSLHELRLSQKYSDYFMLFYKDRGIRLGKTAQLFRKENIEQAYQIPYSLLFEKESLYRQHLSDRTEPLPPRN